MLGFFGAGFHAFLWFLGCLLGTIGEPIVNCFRDIGGKSGVVFLLNYKGLKFLTADS